MNKYSKDKNKFYCNDKVLIIMNSDIKDYIILKDLVIILEDPIKSKNERNVYCFNLLGALIWQIPQPEKLHSENYYISIYTSEKGLLQAYNKNGVEVSIDGNDGSILKKELIK